uniref:Uncharacterized protein n=1 Tax=Cannabis sativa TaxID=3483 RepID=A0A803P435_CANSA
MLLLSLRGNKRKPRPKSQLGSQPFDTRLKIRDSTKTRLTHGGGSSGVAKMGAPPNIVADNREPMITSNKEDFREGMVLPKSSAMLKCANTAPPHGRGDKRAKHSTPGNSESSTAGSLPDGNQQTPLSTKPPINNANDRKFVLVTPNSLTKMNSK